MTRRHEYRAGLAARAPRPYGILLQVLDTFEAKSPELALRDARRVLLSELAAHRTDPMESRQLGTLIEETALGGYKNFQVEDIVKLDAPNHQPRRRGSRIFSKGYSGPYHGSLHGSSVMSNVAWPHTHWRARVVWVPTEENL